MAKDSNKIAYREFGDEEQEIEDTQELPPNSTNSRSKPPEKAKVVKQSPSLVAFKYHQRHLPASPRHLKISVGLVAQ